MGDHSLGYRCLVDLINAWKCTYLCTDGIWAASKNPILCISMGGWKYKWEKLMLGLIKGLVTFTWWFKKVEHTQYACWG